MTLQDKLAKWKEVAKARTSGPYTVDGIFVHTQRVFSQFECPTYADARFVVLSSRVLEALLECASALDAMCKSEALKEAPMYGYSNAVSAGNEALAKLAEIDL